MSLDTDKNREWAISRFPALLDDKHFKITSPCDEDYNCIAFACGKNNIWYWPFPLLDGVCEWPNDNQSLHYSNLVSIFEQKGFIKCDNFEFDKKMVKVALYINEQTENFTHAARQNRDGIWKSKLGSGFDILHGTPYTIENATYGIAKVFMQSKY